MPSIGGITDVIDVIGGIGDVIEVVSIKDNDNDYGTGNGQAYGFDNVNGIKN